MIYKVFIEAVKASIRISLLYSEQRMCGSAKNVYHLKFILARGFFVIDNLSVNFHIIEFKYENIAFKHMLELMDLKEEMLK